MFIERIKSAIKIIIGRKNAGRDATVFPEDIMLVSYPKSGNTWTRFLIANLISNENVTFNNIERIIPDIYLFNDEYLKKIKVPRFLKSHEYFDPKYNKIIFIVRDPRDIVISYWHHCLKFAYIDPTVTLDDFVDLFLSGSISRYGSWGENVQSWLSTRGKSSDFLMVKYEDLLTDTEKNLVRIAAFIKKKRTDNEIKSAVSNSSKDQMRKLEETDSNNWKVLKGTNKNMRFVRDAEKKGWKTELSKESIEKIELKWGDVMKEIGYLD